MDLALNNLQRLICHKTQSTNQPINREDNNIPPPQGRQILCVTFVEEEATKHLTVKIESKVICLNIRTYSKGQTYFFALGYDIVSDKTNLLVDCGVNN